MKKCDYGCDQEAKYYFETVHKWCCSNHYSRCPKNRQINSLSKKGKIPWNKGLKQNNKSKKKQSQSMRKRWRDSNYRRKQKNIRSTKKYLDHMKEIRQGEKNPMSGKTISEEHKKSLRLNINKIRERYPKFFKKEPLRENKNEIVEVKCKYCGSWFLPSRTQIYERIRQVENKNGNMKSYLYCCNEHKFLCPHSNSISPEKLTEYEKYRREVMVKTNKTLKECKVENIKLRGVKYGYQLDHKFSIIAGFKQNIPPSIIGNISNLEVIKDIKNIRKSRACSITKEELYRKASMGK